MVIDSERNALDTVLYFSEIGTIDETLKRVFAVIEEARISCITYS